MKQSLQALSILLCCLALTTACDTLDPDGAPPSESERFPPPDSIETSLTFEDAGYAVFTPDNSGIIVANASEPWGREVATLYDRATGEEIRTFDPYLAHIHRFYSMAISNDGSKLVVAGVFTTSISGTSTYPGFVIYEVATGKILQRSIDLATSKLPTMLAFAPGDSVFVGCLGDFLVSYRTKPKRVPPSYFPELDSASFSGREYGGLSYLEFSPDGRTILTYSLALWDMESRSKIEDLSDTRKWYFHNMAYAQADRRFFGGGIDGIYALSLDSEKPVFHIRSDYLPADDDFYGEDPDVVALAVSPSGQRVAASDNIGRLKIFESTTGKPLFLGETSTIDGDLTFSPDGKAIMAISGNSSSEKRTVRVWELDPE